MENKKTDKYSIRFNIMAILLIAIFCFAITPVTLQNDTFYTIKIGEHILENGIDMQDPFSYHNLEYTYPHWLYDVGIYLIYSVGGQAGIYISTVVLCIMLGILMYLTNIKLTKNKLTSFVITIGAIYLLKDYIAARAQLVTFILFVLTIYCIEQLLETKNRKYAIGLIIIPIIIANVHVAVFPFYFILYLPYIGEYIIYLISNWEFLSNKRKIKRLDNKLNNSEDKNEEIENEILRIKERNKILIEKREKIDSNAYKIKIKKRDNIKALIIIMVICLFTGLVTPLGTTPYTYLVKTMQGNTTQNINEHLPLTLIENENFTCVLILFVAILMFTDTKIRLCDLFMIGGLLFLSFYSRRQVSMFVLAGIFIFNRLVCSMFNKYAPEACKKIEIKATNIIGMITTISLVLTISIINYKPKIEDEYIDKSSYPVEASKYIINELDIENIRLYNEYNYGSYLLYKGIPVFIDSRADLYSPEFNDGVQIFNDFLDLSGVNNDKIEETLSKYEITHLIMYKDAKLRTFIKQDKEKYGLLYEDDYFCIYERK